PRSTLQPTFYLLCGLAGALLFSVRPALALLPSDKSPLPNYDKRGEPELQIPTQRRLALEQLREKIADVKVQFDPITGSPRWIHSEHGFLSGPNGEGGAISAQALARWPQHPHRIVKAFLETQSQLFGHGAEIVDSAVVKQEFVTAHNGLKTV